MRLFTADAVVVLSYLSDKLPHKSDEIFRLAEDGLVRWREVMRIDLPDLHDRMIVATHLTTDSQALLTDDEEIWELNVEVIW